MPLIMPPGPLPRRLFWRLSLPVALLVCALLLVYGVHIERVEDRLVRAEVTAEGQRAATRLALACAQALQARDLDAIQRLALTEMRRAPIQALQVQDRAGRLLTDVDRQGGIPTPHFGRRAPPLPKPAAGSTMGVAQADGTGFQPGLPFTAWAAIPGAGGSPPQGWVRATLETAPVEATDDAARQGLMLAMTAAFLLVMASLYLLTRAPVAALRQARDLARDPGRPSSAPTPAPTGVAEIDQLLQALNDASERQTERNRNLMADRQFLSGIAESLDPGIYAIDLEGRCIFMTRAAERLTGWSRVAMLGQPVDAWLRRHAPEQAAKGSGDAAARAMTTGHAQRDDVVELTRKDGTRFHASAAAAPLLEGDVVKGAVVILQEIPELRHTGTPNPGSEALAGMGHEIRTPMNAIIGMTHLVLDSELTPLQRDHLEKIQDASQHLLMMLDGLVDFSRLETNGIRLDEKPFVLDDLLDAVSDPQGGRSQGTGLAFDVPPDVPQHLIGDFGRLKQILALCIDHVRNGGIDHAITVDIRDTAGPADRAADRARLRFTVHTDGPARGGTPVPNRVGFGLALAQRIARLMDGEAGSDRGPGEARTCWFSARVGIRRQARERPPGNPDQPADVRREQLAPIAGAHVLLVEDNLLNQELSRHFLIESGCSVDVAENGEVALSLLADKPAGAYDLILMDINMPVMDGLEATARIRTLAGSERLPIVAMTASTSEAECQACLAAGMDAFLSKPITPRNLWPMLLKWIPARTPPLARTGVDPIRLQLVVDELARLLAGSELAAIHTLHEHAGLLQSAFPEAYLEIEAALADFDFERAMAALRDAVDDARPAPELSKPSA